MGRLVNESFALSCGHRVVYRSPFPAIGETVYCIQCETSAVILGDETAMEWHMSCTQCSTGKWTGQSELDAEFYAANHSRKKGHLTEVKREVNPMLKRRLSSVV